MDTTVVTWIPQAITGGVIVLLLIMSLFVVREKTAVVIERFGRFVRINQAGLKMKIPLIESIVGRVNLRVLQLDVSVDTKTQDNVFTDVKVSVQYRVDKENVYKAHYLLENTLEQMESYIFDVVRATVPTMKLDDIFSNKDKIATEVAKDLADTMKAYGYVIVKALVTEINPAENVMKAMNRIETAKREKEAAKEEGEAQKIIVVKQAEAEAESKKLQGKGIADQRLAIAKGLKESTEEMKQGLGENATGQEVMEILLMVQHFDTVKEVAGASHTNTLFMDHSPAGLTDLRKQITQGIIGGKKGSEGKV